MSRPRPAWFPVALGVLWGGTVVAAVVAGWVAEAVVRTVQTIGGQR